jgi:hypothetical protein
MFVYLFVFATPVAYFAFFRDVWIRTQRAAVAGRRATNLATHLPNKMVSSLPRSYLDPLRPKDGA